MCGKYLRRLARASVSQNAVELGFVDKHTARLGAFVAADDPAALEHVDQAPRPCVADAQPALEERSGSSLRLDDDFDCSVQERILVRVEIAVCSVVLTGRRLRRFEQRLVQLLLTLSPTLLDDEGDLLLADVGALDALHP